MSTLIDRLRIRIDVLLDERESQRNQIIRLTRDFDRVRAERDLLRREFRGARRAGENAELARRITETENARLRKALGRRPAPHGTEYGYSERGCRCELCFEWARAHREVHSGAREKRQAAA